MKKSKKTPPILRTYKTTIRYTCPTRGEVEEEVEVPVYASGAEADQEVIDIDKLEKKSDEIEEG